jgi:hypothetical protein
MSRAQSTIIWLGLALVVMNIAVNWTEVRDVLFGKKPASTTSASKPTLVATPVPVSTPPVVMV